MSILIKGMEIPKNCCECPVNMNICNRGYKYLSEHPELYDKRANDCPIIELPPKHGRLIDADAMIVSVKRQTDVLRIIGGDLAATAEVLEKGILQEIKNAPTIIEAEGADG